MIKRNRQKTLLAWLTALVLLFSAFAPLKGVHADIPTTLDSAEVVDGFNEEIAPADTTSPTDIIDDIGNDDKFRLPGDTPIPAEPTEDPVDDGEIGLPVDTTTTPEPTEEAEDDGENELPAETPAPLGTPETLDATVVVEGVDEGGIIDSSEGVSITVTLPSIPVEGDGVEDYFVWGDSFELLLSENFMFELPLPDDQFLYFGSVLVGTVEFSNNAEGQAIATIIFNGDPTIFDPELMDPEPPYAGVSAEFDCTLVWNNTYEEDENGDEYVVILDKTYELQVPGDVLTYGVTKEVATVDLDAGTITWTVTITGESDTVPPTPLDLAGFLFEDDLTNVGAYLADSFLVNGTAATPATTAPLTYTFPEPSVSPQTITFTTTIPDSVLTNGGTITNEAEVYDGEDLIGSDSDATTIVGPSASKVGEANDGFGEDGSYNPEDRTITWTVTVDNEGQTLNGLTITDLLQDGLTLQSAVWERWDPVTETWIPVTGISWTTEPVDGIYDIGDVDYLGRLVIISEVPDQEDGSVAAQTYYNQATASWTSPGGTDGTAQTGNPGIGIGYDAITKSGTQSDADKENHQISWTINADLKGQSPTDFVYYDLFVHDAATTNAALTSAAGWPAGISIGGSGISRNNGQKYVSHTADSHLSVTTIDLNGLATLVMVTDLRATGTNQVVIKSQVLDPDILAGNNASQSVPNTTSLFKGTTYRGRASASVPFNNMVLGKEMLRRVEVENDHDAAAVIDPNNRTTNAGAGFHYDYREVIFRLNINAAGLDFADVETNLTDGFGTVTITDTLPTGWEFSAFSGGQNFLIYNADGSSVASGSPLDPSTISGFGAVFASPTATFTFTNLDQPYVILVKAKPTDTTFDGYLVGENTRLETNSLGLKTTNWELDDPVTQNVRIDSKIIEKSIDLSQQNEGILTWNLDYTPFNRPIATAITDTLPEGIDLRLDSSGAIIWEQDGSRNINVYELIPNENGNGSYSQSGELDLLQIQSNFSYDNETRTLTFTFPDNTKGYRISYLTDITGQPGNVTNSASLIGAQGEGTGTSESFLITDQHGSASLGRSGYVALRKASNTGSNLADAEFTLYNTNADGSIGSPRAVRISASNGTIRIYGLQPGTYILKETNPPDGYFNPVDEYTVVVAADYKTTINGVPFSLSDPIVITNYQVSQESGSLTISKTVAGNGGDLSKLFAFTVTFENDTSTYPYQGSGGAANGTITSGDTIYLSHGQSITVLGLPEGTVYTVVEADYSADGYITTYTGDTGTIVVGQGQIADFTNTREIGSLTISKTVTGNGGDTTKLFSFTVTFTGAPYTYPYVGSGGAADGTITSGDTITLSHGQSITINDLPKDATYTVVEADYSADGYVTTYTGDTGTIREGETSTAAFVNARELGSLTIRKTVVGNGGDTNKLFAFTVTFTGAPLTYPYLGSGGALDGTITNGDTIYLSHGQSITINELPKDASYTIVEADYSADGYITTHDGSVGIIVEDDTQVASFTNTREIGSLTINKTVAGNGGDTSKLFAFTITFTGAPLTYPYVGSGGAADGTIVSGGTIYLSHGQSITINDLPKDATYTVVEADYSADGYVTTHVGSNGTIVVDATQVASFTNTRQIGSLMIRKTVTGDLGDRNRYFTFVVEFGSNETYSYHGSKLGTIRSGQSVLLKHDEYIVIEGILVGTSYKVTELEAYQGGYTTTSTGSSGLITVDRSTAAFVNWRSSVPATGDDDSANIGRIGLLISVPLLLGLSGVYGFLQAKRRKQPLS